jgi:sporulation protein YlmC with PRC-barrel domain
MIRASDLLGCVVRTESGKKVGRVHDLRAKTTEGDCLLIGLVVGRGGMLARLAGGGADGVPTRGGDIVPWHAITRLEEGRITIRGRSR